MIVTSQMVEERKTNGRGFKKEWKESNVKMIKMEISRKEPEETGQKIGGMEAQMRSRQKFFLKFHLRNLQYYDMLAVCQK